MNRSDLGRADARIIGPDSYSSPHGFEIRVRKTPQTGYRCNKEQALRLGRLIHSAPSPAMRRHARLNHLPGFDAIFSISTESTKLRSLPVGTKRSVV